VLIGCGANGKGTTYGAITHALGDYATVINPDLLMVRDRGGAGGPELMALLGVRLVIGSETEEGRKLDEAAMKRLTGGDELTARRLYSHPVTWQPSHQLVYVTNALPKVKGNDPAVWRRIRVVPFDVVVPLEDRDPELPERLALHADAVLSWVIAGHFDYEDNGGMREPTSVLRATGDYQADATPSSGSFPRPATSRARRPPRPASCSPRGSGGRYPTPRSPSQRRRSGLNSTASGTPAKGPNTGLFVLD